MAITIAGGVAKENITGIKEASKLANMTDAQDKAIIDGNIFVDCKEIIAVKIGQMEIKYIVSLYLMEITYI